MILARLYEVLNMIQSTLGDYSPLADVVKHYLSKDGEKEYLSIRIHIPQVNALIMIREYWEKGQLLAYGYYIQVKHWEEWWDNRPHHPEIGTYPHHKHSGGMVAPLEEHSLGKFLQHVKSLLHTI